ncbi:cytochrome c-type biogenesis protein [Nocardioides cheoyonin]|uniref:cytochrome c-type biogenesis protein n=1 Tax=Nocardioides cheoyonin TaxID=3156615 RepID=UPI0032B46A7B
MDLARVPRLRRGGPWIRRLLIGAAALVALAVLAVALLSGHGTRSLDDRTQDVAGRLRCPTCVAESAADSTSPVAESMRSEIRRQLAAGRSDDQVVAWFRTRYGSDIVLEPQRHGLGWVLWVAPPVAGVAVVGGCVLLVRRRRGRPGQPVTGQAGDAPPLPAARLAVALTVAVGAAVAVPLLVLGGPDDGASAGRSDAAAPTASSSASPSASRSASSDDPVTVAFALLRAGNPAAAEKLIRPVATGSGADRPLALLVLGLAQRANGEITATHTLRTFVHRYPDHPATAEVRRLLAAG